MKFTPVLFGFLFVTMMTPSGISQAPADKGATLSVEDRIEALLRKMTLEEKVAMLGGDATGFNSCGVERLGIPPIRMSDGPIGVRGSGPATAFPAPINMAASWDPELEFRYGAALGEEATAKGKTCILGSCVDIGRFPLGGRNFESFGEDPFLSSRMAVNVIRGIQSRNVIATVKHYACNDQEWERNSYDVLVDERTLREIHLPVFEAAVKEAEVKAVMTAYNLVNGEHCSENRHLVTDILKNDWGFQGIVMSDWVSVYSADKAANNGLDVEMPHPAWFKDKLLAAIRDGRVSQEVIDDKVRRHLRVRFQAGLFEHPSPRVDESVIHSDAHKALAVEMARKSIILLKNEQLLPLAADRIKTIALIGPSARTARTGGGGSSQVQPWETVSPQDGLSAIVGNSMNIEYAEGSHIDTFTPVPIPPEFVQTPDGKSHGLMGEYYNNPRFEGKPVFTRVDQVVDFEYHGDHSPDPRIGATNYSIRWTGRFTSPETRKYRFTVTSDDGSRLFINGELKIDNWGTHGPKTLSCEMPMAAGKAYDLKVEYNQVGGDAMMYFGWRDPADRTPEPSIDEAVRIARKADVAIVCVGNTAALESEGDDVSDFKMTGDQDELVQAVTKANPNTIVVVYGGVPVLMKNWLHEAKAVIAALYPGQEGGTALAQILFGSANPSGKLPFSYIQERSQSPAFAGYQATDLRVPYAEGVFVGYRYYDKNHIEPLFPFGYGLSYTTFEYRNLKVEKSGDQTCVVNVDVRNTGPVAGEEVVQLYVAPKNASVDRPIKELKGFAKLMLQPGETKTVSIPLNQRAFQFFHPVKKQWTLEPGSYEILIGASSRDVRLTGEVEM
jgi:beta-glucosidase